jgi:hypothetical protein
MYPLHISNHRLSKIFAKHIKLFIKYVWGAAYANLIGLIRLHQLHPYLITKEICKICWGSVRERTGAVKA